MNKFVSAFMAAMGIACLNNMPASAQDLAMLGKSGTAPFERTQTKSLKTVLDKLELKYNVHFMYKSKLAKLQLSNVEESTTSIDEELKSITVPNKLRYKKLGEGFYIIFAQDDEPATPTTSNGGLNTIASSISPEMITSSALRAIPVTGVVTDDKGQPIPGVTVLVKGTTTGTTTDVNGTWKLNVPDATATLEFSFIGYVKQEVPVNGTTNFSIKLMQDVTSMSEVVVVGYGTQKKVNVTGAVTAIDGKDISAKPIGQVSTALQGVAPGVTVTTGSGQPGKDQGTVKIRGVGTFNNTDPLVLVDGVQMSMNDIDANDISSYSVLKDAAASAIYGVRAANGVILITTKRGTTGKAKVTYSNYFGWQKPARLAKYVGAQDFMKLVNQTAGTGIYSDTQISAYNDPNRDTDVYPDNYWLKKILTGSGFQQEHSLGIAGGSENVKYHFSANYFDQKGLIRNMDFNRITVRLNTDINVTKKLTFSADISARLNDRNEPQGVAGSAWYQFGQGAVINPLTVNRFKDGQWGIVRGGQNPIRLQEEGGLYNYKSNLFSGNFKGVYDLVKGLKLTGTAAVNYQSDYNSQREKILIYETDPLHPDLSVTKPFGQNSLIKEAQGYWFKNFQGIAEYTKQFGKHSFKLLGGASQLNETTDYLYGFRKNLATGTTQLDGGEMGTQTNKGWAMEYNLVSFFGRLNYNFDEKYLIEANIRRDGSSRFPDGQRWGTFPSFSLGWRVSQESFMRDITWLNDLKLRGSWGQLGNDRVIVDKDNPLIVNYPYQTTYNYNSYPFGGVLNPTAGIKIYPNSGLTWETATMTDIGLDATVLNKLDVTFDWYNRTTKNILMTLPIPSSVGLDPAAMNAAKVQNIGWELGLNYHNTIGDKGFKYNVGFNIADVKNKILDVKGSDQITKDNNNIYTGYVTGQAINTLYGYKSEGIFQTAEQVASHATQDPKTGAGDLIYKDIDGNGVISQALDRKGGDLVNIGNTMPRFTYGFNLGASYKHFDFSAFFQGVGKVDIMTLPIERAPTSTDGNFRKEHLDSWTPSNTGAAFPRLQTSTQNYFSSSYWVRSGAYLRLKNVSLGYSLPANIFGKSGGFDRFRVYVSGSNLLTFSSLPNDIDPETPNDSRYYPQVKTYTFGFNVSF
ncbi:SusC/RagA family TonB-linked outer membrane protein [Chitinophaga sancti]|uniref:SusC/RagA family TonB-linked outer membrane protein n=1 Tax=Chitinophaga sancti TaxID=1004 RepID=UPI003F7B1FB5